MQKLSKQKISNNEATQTPLTLRGTVCSKNEKRFETVIRGIKITASFATNPDEKILKLVKKILVDSHTHTKEKYAS